MAFPALKVGTTRVLALLAILLGVVVVAGGMLMPLHVQQSARGFTWIRFAEVTPGGWDGRKPDLQQASPVALPDPWHLSGRQGVWTYHIQLPPRASEGASSIDVPDVTQGLWIPRASTVLAIWVDEQLIVGMGSEASTFTDRPWLVSLPRRQVGARQSQVHIVVAGLSERASGLSSVAHGPMAQLGPLRDIRDALLTGGGLSVFAATLMMCAGAGWVAFHLSSMAVLLFMCTTGLMCMREALVLWGTWFLSAQVRDAMVHASAGAAFVVSGFLLLGYLEHRAPQWEASAKGLLLLVLPTWAASVLRLPASRDAMLLWYGLSHAAGFWVTVIVATEVLRRPTAKRALILLSAVGVMACTFLDDWHTFLSSAPSSYEFFRLAPAASVSALLSVVVTTYLRVFRALVAEGRFKADLLIEVNRQRMELEHLHAAIQEKAKAEVTARERSRIARDLHDGLGSQLVHILSDVESGEVAQANLITELTELLDQLRLTMDTLDPIAKDVHDLLAQMRYRLKDRWRRAGITLAWSVEPISSDRRFTPDELASLQRVLYEVFANIVKHAKASHVSIQTFSDPLQNVCGIVIRDDGIGFSPSRHPSGRGLQNIASRANEMGVSTHVVTKEGHGVTLTLSWPSRSH